MFTSQTSNNCKNGITFVHSIMAENFVVSALKYRPQTFDTVVGQSHITTTLKNAIKTNQLAHSFLFCGPRGVGKTTCARILAKTINCLTPTANFEACDTCENCVSFKNNTSFNVHELDAASNNSVDDIRVLTDQVRFAPQGGSKYKVYIIDEVHMLSQQAFNAFLKTLEEPPSYAIFILATTEKHKILPTILSRCQIFDFKRITTKDTVDHLQHICEIEKVSAETDALHFIALKSEGCMRDSLSIMDKIISFGGGQITYTNTIENLNILDYDYFFKMTEAVATQNLSSAMLMYDDILAKGFEGDMFMNGFAEHFRNLMMCKDERIVRLMDVAEGIKKRYFDQANSISNSLIINAISILNNSELDYKMARNKRLHVEMALIKLCHLIQAIQIVSHADGIAKKKLTTNFISPIFKKAAASLQIDESLIAKTAANASSIVAEPIVQPIAVAHKKEETIVKPIVSNTNTSGSNGGIKLANLKSIADKAKEALAEKATQQKIAITAENLKEVWQKTIVHFAEGKEFFATSMKNARVSFDKETISIIALDMMGAEFMMSNKLPITQFLMAQFVNNHLHVIMDKDIQASQDTTKTTKSIKEKYDDFVKENPLVQKMKDDLGLEMEY
ncbi:MAG: DNA polymerase III subunit gamma/tau [Chitinophagaceae bacterium]|nr:DNA polymerase III subunit gamma/tau [Chitinophagaceae bacterium]